MIVIELELGALHNLKTIYAYTGKNLTRIERNNDLTTGDAGRMTYLSYDNFDRLLTVEVNGPSGRVTIASYTYDSAGNRLTSEDADGLITNYGYDALNRLAWLQEPGKTTYTCFKYDALGNKTEERRGASSSCTGGVLTTYAYDGASRLISVTDPLTYTTQYDYDASGNLTSVTDDNSHTTAYSYNLLSQLLSTNGPLSNDTVSYTYDAAGRLTQKQDAKHQEIIYTYDDSNYLAHLTEIAYVTYGSTTEKTRSFKRNNAGQITHYCDTLLMGSTSDCTTTPTDPVYSYTYDALGRTKDITNHYLQAEGVYSSPLVYEYNYDQFGNRKSLKLTSGVETVIDFTYNYNQMDQLATIGDGILSGDTIGLSFTTSGKMDQIRHMNAAETNLAYSSTTGQLTAINHLTSGDTTILSLGYPAYDTRNNITQKVIDNKTTAYTYDSKDQLTGVQVGTTTTETYTYDGVGNRLTALETGSTAWTYNAGNQLTAYPPNHTFTYDNNGNMLTMAEGATTETLTYSVDDRLARYQKSPTDAHYYYDYSELRVKKDVNGARTYFIYDGTVLLKEITKNSGGTTTDERYYTFMPGSYYPLAMTVKESGTWETYAYHNDHLMTPLKLTDESQNIDWIGSYKAFGQVNITGSLTNNLRFPGQWMDSDTGMHYNHSRYYSSYSGRYNITDPIYLNTFHSIYKYVSADNGPSDLYKMHELIFFTLLNYYNATASSQAIRSYFINASPQGVQKNSAPSIKILYRSSRYTQVNDRYSFLLMVNPSRQNGYNYAIQNPPGNIDPNGEYAIIVYIAAAMVVIYVVADVAPAIVAMLNPESVEEPPETQPHHEPALPPQNAGGPIPPPAPCGSSPAPAGK